jgi:uncharacterized protein
MFCGRILRGARLTFSGASGLVAQVAEVVMTSTSLDLVAADPDNNPVLECAVDGKADLIASNDHHLLDLKACREIPIIAGPDLRRTLGIP